MIKNPIYIPKSFREKDKYGVEARYKTKLVNGKNLRVIEYYGKEGLKNVNVWGICRELKDLEDCFVAYDENIDVKTAKELRGLIEAMYVTKPAITFF